MSIPLPNPLHPTDDFANRSPIGYASSSTLRGRDPSLDTIQRLFAVDSARLVSLTGPGGVGKTRLSLEVARVMPALVVPLAGISDPRDVLTEIATAGGIALEPTFDPTVTIARELGAHNTLLVLDNLEQIPDVAPIIAALLRADERLRLLVTSRMRLRLSGEHEVSVLPLEWPEPTKATAATLANSSATQLFIDRTLAANPAFKPTDANAPVIAEICRRLDGLPLAIELAAARGRFLSPEAILARMERRLELLTGGATDLPERHQTMRDTIAWSYDLLSEPEAALFRLLGVFSGGFTLDAVDAIASDRESLLDLIGTLSEHGLVLPAVDRNGEPRLAMLETVREFALEQLVARGEEPSARERHAAHFLHAATVIGPELITSSPEQTIWWNRAFADIANFRSALEWLETNDRIDEALRLLTGLDWFWTESTLVAEGVRRAKHLLALDHPSISGRTRALSHSFIAMTAELAGENAIADSHAEAAIDAWTNEGDPLQIAIALYHRANSAYDRGDFEIAAPYAERCVAQAEAIGNHWYAAASLVLLGGIAREHARDYQAATRYLERGIEAFRLSGETQRINGAITSVGLLALMQADLPKALRTYRSALDLESDLDSDRVFAQSIFAGLSLVAVQCGDDHTGVLLRAAAEAAGSLPSMRMRPTARAYVDAAFEPVRARLGEPVFSSLWTRGLSLDFAAAAELARAISLPHAAPPELAQLSKREREIVELIAEGLTDQEIADRTYISRRTASQHVSSILRKLGVTSRAAAAALASRSRS